MAGLGSVALVGTVVDLVVVRRETLATLVLAESSLLFSLVVRYGAMVEVLGNQFPKSAFKKPSADGACTL